MNVMGFKPTGLLKAKYTKRWKGSDGKWRYEYGSPKGTGSSGPKDTGSSKPPSTDAHPAEKLFPGVKVERVLSRRVDFSFRGKTYSITGGGVVAKRTLQPDGKNWYSYQLDFAHSDERKLLEHFAVRQQYNPKKKRTEYYFK